MYVCMGISVRFTHMLACFILFKNKLEVLNSTFDSEISCGHKVDVSETSPKRFSQGCNCSINLVRARIRARFCDCDAAKFCSLSAHARINTCGAVYMRFLFVCR